MVEVLPAENENNYEYLYQLSNMQKRPDLFIILRYHGKKEPL